MMQRLLSKVIPFNIQYIAPLFIATKAFQLTADQYLPGIAALLANNS
jgi:hypothetical protein